MFQRCQPMQQLDIQRDGDHPTAAACAYHGVDWSCPQPPLPIAFRPSSVIRAPREQQARVHHAFWDPRFVFWEYAICRGVRLFFFRSDETEVCAPCNVQRLGRFSTPPPGFSVNRGSIYSWIYLPLLYRARCTTVRGRVSVKTTSKSVQF